jgi:hypothetical protein
MRIHSIALSIVLASAPLASAQSVYNPIQASPYSRPSLSPYLNLNTSGTAASTFYRGVLDVMADRNLQLRPFGASDLLSGYDPYRSPAYQAVTGYQNAEDWVNQRIRETQLSPSGHPTGFLIPNPYYRMPNQRSFIPYNPGTGPQLR